MPAIQALKKRLRGVRSTQKFSKAMRTVSAVKYSRLNKLHADFSEYGLQCEKALRRFGGALSGFVEAKDPGAPAAVIVMSGNKGMCGGFNSEILKFAAERIEELGHPLLVPCGKKAIAFFRGRGMEAKAEYALGDVPGFDECCALLDEMIAWRKSGRASTVYVIYPRYINTLRQEPEMIRLFPEFPEGEDESVLFVPDRATAAELVAGRVYRAMFFALAAQTALGAQAATLMAMRSAYDTASEYCQALEVQINRARQELVTASVIETSSGRVQ